MKITYIDIFARMKMNTKALKIEWTRTCLNYSDTSTIRFYFLYTIINMYRRTGQ